MAINNSKLNQFVLDMPHNSIITSKWLNNHGVSSKLAWWYVKTNWLERVSEKAYKKPHEEILWTGIVHTLQTQLNKPVHVSGKSVLALTGKTHFIPMSRDVVIDLATEERITLPKWLHNEHLSNDKITIHQNKLLNLDNYNEFLISKQFDGFNIRLSCAELAMLEVLALIPHEQDFTEATLLMEGLPYLRVNKVQSLLEKCTSVKAKRLYLYLAGKYNYNWFKKLDLNKIDLGHGKRMIVKGGNYDPIYQITVPKIDGE